MDRPLKEVLARISLSEVVLLFVPYSTAKRFNSKAQGRAAHPGMRSTRPQHPEGVQLLFDTRKTRCSSLVVAGLLTGPHTA